MKVLHVSESDNIGGAAIAATRLFDLLRAKGVNAEFVVSRNKTNRIDIIHPVSFIDRLYAKVIPHLIIRYNRWRFGTTLLTWYKIRSSNFFLKTLDVKIFDILHLHWVNNGFVGMNDLISFNGKMVWTLHDTWLFTAGCHSNQGCENFIANCSPCPKLYGKIHQSNLDFQFNKKHEHLNLLREKIQIIVPSSFMLESVKASKLLYGFKVNVIPNFIDTEVFIPVDKTKAKQFFNLELDVKYIVFGGSDPINDFNKGFVFIKKMAKQGVLNGYTLLLFGKISSSEPLDLEIPYISMGHIAEENKLAMLYNSAELVLMPSLHESFGQVAAEAMACGIPVLCFDTTGLKDVVDHMINGYRAKLEDSSDLVKGFNWIVSQQGLGKLSRNKIRSQFGKEVIFEKYNLLYEELLNFRK